MGELQGLVQRGPLVGSAELDSSFYNNPGRVMATFNREFNSWTAIGQLIGAKNYTRDPNFDAIGRALSENGGRDLIPLAAARNAEEYDDIGKSLIQQRDDQSVLDHQSFGKTLAIGSLIGLADPMNVLLLPFAIPRGLKMSEILYRSGGAGLVASSVQEGLLQASRSERGPLESAVNVGSATLLGGLFGTFSYRSGRSLGDGQVNETSTPPGLREDPDPIATLDDEMVLGGASTARQDVPFNEVSRRPDVDVERDAIETVDGNTQRDLEDPDIERSAIEDVDSVATQSVPLIYEVFEGQATKAQRSTLISQIINLAEDVMPQATRVRLQRVIEILPENLLDNLTVRIRHRADETVDGDSPDLGLFRNQPFGGQVEQTLSVFTSGYSVDGHLLAERSPLITLTRSLTRWAIACCSPSWIRTRLLRRSRYMTGSSLTGRLMKIIFTNGLLTSSWKALAAMWMVSLFAQSFVFLSSRLMKVRYTRSFA